MTVEVDHTEVTYTLRDGPHGTLTIRHAGEPLEITTEKPTTVALQPREPLLPPAAAAAGPRTVAPGRSHTCRRDPMITVRSSGRPK